MQLLAQGETVVTPNIGLILWTALLLIVAVAILVLLVRAVRRLARRRR